MPLKSCLSEMTAPQFLLGPGSASNTCAHMRMDEWDVAESAESKGI